MRHGNRAWRVSWKSLGGFVEGGRACHGHGRPPWHARLPGVAVHCCTCAVAARRWWRTRTAATRWRTRRCRRCTRRRPSSSPRAAPRPWAAGAERPARAGGPPQPTAVAQPETAPSAPRRPLSPPERVDGGRARERKPDPRLPTTRGRTMYSPIGWLRHDLPSLWPRLVLLVFVCNHLRSF